MHDTLTSAEMLKSFAECNAAVTMGRVYNIDRLFHADSKLLNKFHVILCGSNEIKFAIFFLISSLLCNHYKVS